jgi:HPt (histidine-containing phosphotransfer) domain-containing protein
MSQWIEVFKVRKALLSASNSDYMQAVSISSDEMVSPRRFWVYNPVNSQRAINNVGTGEKMQSNITPAQPEHHHISSDEQQDDVIIDTEVLNVVSNHGGDAAFLQYLLGLFEKHGQQSLDELKAALQKRDPAALRHVAHRWRGSCLNVGAVRLAEVLGRIEDEPISGQEPEEDLELIGKNCEELFQRSCQLLRQQLPGIHPS